MDRGDDAFVLVDGSMHDAICSEHASGASVPTPAHSSPEDRHRHEQGGRFGFNSGDCMPSRAAAARFPVPPEMPAVDFSRPAPGSAQRRHRGRPAFPASTPCPSLTVAASTSVRALVSASARAAVLYEMNVPQARW